MRYVSFGSLGVHAFMQSVHARPGSFTAAARVGACRPGWVPLVRLTCDYVGAQHEDLGEDDEDDEDDEDEDLGGGRDKHDEDEDEEDEEPVLQALDDEAAEEDADVDEELEVPLQQV